MFTKYRCSYTSSYVSLSAYLQFLWMWFRNLELCSVCTAINELFRQGCTTCIRNTPPPPRKVTHQYGHIWRNDYLKRLNPHDWGGGKQEIHGYMCSMTLPDVHPIVHKTSCPEYCKCKQIELIIGLDECADILHAKVIVHFRWDCVTTPSPFLDRAFFGSLLHSLIKKHFWTTDV